MSRLRDLTIRIADRNRARPEAEVQADIRTLLLDAPLNLDDPEVRLETQVGDQRRIDVEVGRTVIEVKRDLRVGHIAEQAIEQLAGYVRAREEALNTRYVGVLTDGAEWRLYHLEPSGELSHVSTLIVDAAQPDLDTLFLWLEGVLATAAAIPPTPHEIESRLGALAPGHLLDRASLAALYESCRDDPHVALKRELWARLLQTAFGTNFVDNESLFLEHTYLVLLAELIAHAVVGFNIGDPQQSPRALVSGQLFEHAQIRGVVESDFFDWPVDTPEGMRFVSELARRVARFDWSHVEHDVLKVLYESVIDAGQRHALGEFYTPDWLAQQMVERSVDEPLEQRVLDPSCGSGTFLFWAVRRYLDSAEAQGRSLADALGGVTTRVLGVDVHPVAATLARVTYLLAIGSDRLSSPDRPPISIPVYLGDSLQWRRDHSLLAGGDVTIATSDGAELFARELRFPGTVVADAGRFDQLVAALADRATARTPGSAVPPILSMLSRFGVSSQDREVIEATFTALCALVDDGRNHIWGYYVRNLARPYSLSLEDQRVDVLVGNPPWLAYRYMTNEMQELFKARSRSRGLWAGGSVATNQDLSGYFVARSVELYLADRGRFGFVMPLAALSRRQHAGFRTGVYGGDEAVRIDFDTPWDLDGVRPTIFPVPSCVVFGRRTTDGNAVALPAEKTVWSGVLPSPNVGWSLAAEHLTTREGTAAIASSSTASPYAERFFQGASLYPRVLTVVEDAPSGPLGVGAGRRSVRSSRSNLERPPWRGLDTLNGSVEAQYVRPLYLGATVLHFRALAPSLTVIPWDGRQLLDGSSSELDQYPGLADWWRAAESAWESNKSATTRMSLREQIDYQSKLRNQFPIATQRIVYSKSGTILASARVEDPNAIINGDLYWAAVASRDEGDYLCAILNSATVLARVAEFQSRGAFGARHFDKYVFQVAIPEFKPANELHRTLAILGQRAEIVAAAAHLGHEDAFRNARQQIRAALATDGVAAEIETAVEALLAP